MLEGAGGQAPLKRMGGVVADDDDVTRDQGSGHGDASSDAHEHANTGSDQESGPSDKTRDDEDDPRIRRANREAAAYRRQLREAEAAREALEERLAAVESERKTGNDDEAQRLADELKTLRERDAAQAARLRRVALRAEVAAQARVAGLADVDAALAIMRDRDPDFRALEWDGDEPEAESVRDALTDLLEAKPFLRVPDPKGVAKSSSGNAGGTGGDQGKEPGETIEQRRARLYGRDGASIFDPNIAAALGGGVINPDAADR